MSAGFSPDTSVAAFPPKSTFAFTFWGKDRQVPKSFPLAHWISLRVLPAIFQLRLLGLTEKSRKYNKKGGPAREPPQEI
jgi:hypothetical protein